MAKKTKILVSIEEDVLAHAKVLAIKLGFKTFSELVVNQLREGIEKHKEVELRELEPITEKSKRVIKRKLPQETSSNT